MSKEGLEITLDFYADWTAMLRYELWSESYDIGIDEEPFEICKKFFNVRKRKIPAKQRTVLIPSQFHCPPEHQTAFDAIIKKATQGEDLTPYLSTRLLDSDYNDQLLNDWGIHHFHLGTTPDARHANFVARTGPLLFARVTSDHFYVIAVMEHGSWSQKSLLEILHTNWPESLKDYRLRGIIGLSQEPSEDDLQEFRKHGVMALVQLSDGTIYGPIGGGYATSGVSIEVVRQCDYFKHLTRQLEQWVTKNADRLVSVARDRGARIGPRLHFRLVEFSAKQASVLEENSRTVFSLPLAREV